MIVVIHNLVVLMLQNNIAIKTNYSASSIIHEMVQFTDSGLDATKVGLCSNLGLT